MKLILLHRRSRRRHAARVLQHAHHNVQILGPVPILLLSQNVPVGAVNKPIFLLTVCVFFSGPVYLFLPSCLWGMPDIQ